MGDSERRPETSVSEGWVLLLGDAMRDVYIEGWAKDISAEAPIVRVADCQVTDVPGGAANVERLLFESGVKVDAYFGAGYPLKCRVLADGHQIARFDVGDHCYSVLLPPNFSFEGCRAVIVSDYCKGSISEEVLSFLATVPYNIPIFVDTKGEPLRYTKSVVFFPNSKEYTEFYYQRAFMQSHVVWKRGALGINYNYQTYQYAPSKVVSVVGAGDVVLAAFVYAMLGGREYSQCADFASYAGTRKVECPRTEAPPLKEMFEQWQNITSAKE